MSELLKAFYLAYAAWLDDGAPPNTTVFRRNVGLCTNHHWYASDQGVDGKAIYLAEDQLRSQFMEAGLDVDYPFDDDEHNYWTDSESNTQHLNPKRNQWVRNQVEKIKEL